MAKDRNVHKKAPEYKPKMKNKEGFHIHHDLHSNRFGWVTGCLGEDATTLFEAIDKYYSDYQKKISMGDLKQGTPFDYYITRSTSDKPWDAEVVNYALGSTLKRRGGGRKRYDDDEDDYDYFSSQNY